MVVYFLDKNNAKLRQQRFNHYNKNQRHQLLALCNTTRNIRVTLDLPAVNISLRLDNFNSYI